MADVFISYHDKTNGDRAEKIAATLESAGITCWYARRDVPAGGDFTHEVIKQIGDCKVFLLLLDDGAARSPHVETEVGNAFGRRKKIMPYHTDKKDIKSVSWVQYYLKQVQIVSLPDYGTLTKEIAAALGRPVKTLTPEPQTAQQKPKITEAFIIEFTLIFVMNGSFFGFLWGYDTSFNWFLTITLDDFFKGVLGAFMGYYMGWLVSYIILFIIAKRTDNPDILLGADDLNDSSQSKVMILVIWYLIGMILGGIIGYRISGEMGTLCGGAIALFLFYAFLLLPLQLKKAL